MTNKINGVDNNRSQPVGAGRAIERVREGATDAKAGAGTPDGVNITGTAQQLAALEEQLKQMPAVDEARVAAVRVALEQGTYTIVPDRIADQMLQLEQALAPLYGDKK